MPKISESDEYLIYRAIADETISHSGSEVCAVEEIHYSLIAGHKVEIKFDTTAVLELYGSGRIGGLGRKITGDSSAGEDVTIDFSASAAGTVYIVIRKVKGF
tara:strand:+ start:497 stop:802 length:306 start_codon:yes stop_codon:yes gene_type:complete